MIPMEDTSLKHCGYEDSVIRHLEILVEDEDYEKCNTENLSKRYFTVKCLENIESLDLSWDDLDMMKKDFAQPSRQFIKWQIVQSMNILKNLRHILR